MGPAARKIKTASSKEQMEKLTVVGRAEGSNLCPPAPASPPGSGPGPPQRDSCPGWQSGPANRRQAGRRAAPTGPSLLQASLLLPFLQRSQICHSDALTKPGNEWRTRETRARRGPQQPGNFPDSASEPPPLKAPPPPALPSSPRPPEERSSVLCHQNRIVLARRKNGSSRWQV